MAKRELDHLAERVDGVVHAAKVVVGDVGPAFAVLALGKLGQQLDLRVGVDVNDALGEIANMLGGYVKQILSKGGLDISLSIPTVISGEEYTINAMTDSDCVIIPFNFEESRFLVGLKLSKEA